MNIYQRAEEVVKVVEHARDQMAISSMTLEEGSNYYDPPKSRVASYEACLILSEACESLALLVKDLAQVCVIDHT